MLLYFPFNLPNLANCQNPRDPHKILTPSCLHTAIASPNFYSVIFFSTSRSIFIHWIELPNTRESVSLIVTCPGSPGFNNCPVQVRGRTPLPVSVLSVTTVLSTSACPVSACCTCLTSRQEQSWRPQSQTMPGVGTARTDGQTDSTGSLKLTVKDL